LPEQDAGCAGVSATWISATPFCLVRHPKRNGKDSPRARVELELARRGLPAALAIEPLARPERGPGSLEWRSSPRPRSRSNMHRRTVLVATDATEPQS
jgi:hypothetical protein